MLQLGDYYVASKKAFICHVVNYAFANMPHSTKHMLVYPAYVQAIPKRIFLIWILPTISGLTLLLTILIHNYSSLTSVYMIEIFSTASYIINI